MHADDQYLAARQRRTRLKALLATSLILGAVGWAFWSSGQKASQFDAKLVAWEEGLRAADADSLGAVTKATGTVLFDDTRAPGSVAAADARAQILLHVLYSGIQSQRERARDMVELAQERDPGGPATRLAGAMVQAMVGDTGAALRELDRGAVPPILADQAAVARAEALLRRGDLEGAASALDGAGSALGRTWAARVAWRSGDPERAERAATAALVQNPEISYAALIKLMARARAEDDASAAASLGARLESSQPLSALHAAALAVELSRALRRQGKVDQADELLGTAAEADEGSLVLQAEVARASRFRGSFGAARTASDKALRIAGDDPEMLAELAQAAFFNDDPRMIDDRAARVPKASRDSDGVRRAQAIANLLKGTARASIEGLVATRHLGIPGETELWLAEAQLRSELPADALASAQQASALLASATGTGSREHTIARLYEALALAASGDLEGGRAILDDANRAEVRTPWAHWLVGRFHLTAGNAALAGGSHKVACNSGQDFALACHGAAEIYKSLSGDGKRARLERELWSHYLRTSPRGFHADEMKAALDRD